MRSPFPQAFSANQGIRGILPKQNANTGQAAFASPNPRAERSGRHPIPQRTLADVATRFAFVRVTARAVCANLMEVMPAWTDKTWRRAWSVGATGPRVRTPPLAVECPRPSLGHGIR
jgi:hypothetical protein